MRAPFTSGNRQTLQGGITRRRFGGMMLGSSAALLATRATVFAQTPAASPVAGAFPRTVVDARGQEVVIPAQPQRVYTFRNYIEYDTALALGVVPAGWGSPGWGLTPYQVAAGGLDNPVSVGDGPDLEEMMARDIDLILVTTFAAELRSEELVAMEQLGVPIVALPDTDIHGQLAIAGQALGREDVAQQVAADFDAQVTAFTPEVMPASIMIIMFYDVSQFYLYTDAASASKTLVQLGLPALSSPVEPPEGERPDMVTLSVERAAEIDAEWVLGLIDDDPVLAEEMMNLPVFGSIPAVKAGKFRTLDASPANAISGPDVLTLPITIAALEAAFTAE